MVGVDIAVGNLFKKIFSVRRAKKYPWEKKVHVVKYGESQKDRGWVVVSFDHWVLVQRYLTS